MVQGIIRPLKAEEIECRAASVNETGLSLLLYKDARVDQRILDETFGVFGWKRSHQCMDGNLYCTVEILDRESGVWVAKQDVGTAGPAEKEKAQASDAFKRACFNWGIGRELYTAPFIWIPAGKADIRKKGERFFCSEHFRVDSIGYNAEREITQLKILDGKGRTAYEWQKKNAACSPAEMEALKAELERTGVTMEAVQDRYNIRKPETMSAELYGKIMNALKKTKTAGAA